MYLSERFSTAGNISGTLQREFCPKPTHFFFHLNEASKIVSFFGPCFMPERERERERDQGQVNKVVGWVRYVVLGVQFFLFFFCFVLSYILDTRTHLRRIIIVVKHHHHHHHYSNYLHTLSARYRIYRLYLLQRIKTPLPPKKVSWVWL